jgi:hypothetical protein
MLAYNGSADDACNLAVAMHCPSLCFVLQSSTSDYSAKSPLGDLVSENRNDIFSCAYMSAVVSLYQLIGYFLGRWPFLIGRWKLLRTIAPFLLNLKGITPLYFIVECWFWRSDCHKDLDSNELEPTLNKVRSRVVHWVLVYILMEYILWFFAMYSSCSSCCLPNVQVSHRDGALQFPPR